MTDEPVVNIGDCILEERRLTESMEKEDVRSVGYMMLELMEVDSSLARPKSSVMRTRINLDMHHRGICTIRVRASHPNFVINNEYSLS